MQEKEIWKDAIDYEGYYMVSNLGRVKTVARELIRRNNSKLPVKERIRALNFQGSGYLCVNLKRGRNTSRMINVHRLIAKAFIPNPKNKPCVNHKNCIKTDNRVENLEWCTRSENSKHAYDNGLLTPPKSMLGKFGYKHPHSKEVFALSMHGDFLMKFGSTREAERETGVLNSNISACCLNKPHCISAGGFKWMYAEDYYAK